MPPNRLYYMMVNCSQPGAVEAAAGDRRPAKRGQEQIRFSPRRRRQRGSQFLEMGLMVLPVFGFIFLLMDVAWAVRTQAILQYAVAEGVRYAVTSQTMAGLGQRASIQMTVQASSFGLLSTDKTVAGTNGWNSIYVNWFLPDGTVEDGITGGNGEQNGIYPLVKVSIQNFSQRSFMPSIVVNKAGQLNNLNSSAVAWDRMEAPPMSGIPAQ